MVFEQIIFQNRYVELETPPPLHGKIHLKFPFWLFAPLPNPHQRKGIQVRPLQKFIWWSWNPKKARTHPQWREEKTYTCSECKKSFGRRGTLRNHMVTHTGKKVQKCAECGDSFPRPFILKTHMLTHSGKKPHNCTQSDFASSRAGSKRFGLKRRYNGRVMAREVYFYQCLWVTKFCAKFGCSRTPRTASIHKSFIVLRCMWKEPAPLRLFRSLKLSHWMCFIFSVSTVLNPASFCICINDLPFSISLKDW